MKHSAESMVSYGSLLLSAGFGVAGGILGDYLRKLFFKARLKLSFGGADGSCLLNTPLNTGNKNGTIVEGTEMRACRILVSNKSGWAATNALVYMRQFDDISEGKTLVFRDSIPLRWSYSDSAEPRLLPAKFGHYVDVFAFMQGRNNPELCAKRTPAIVKEALRVADDMREPKKFRLALEATADNCAPNRLILDVNFQGNTWDSLTAVQGL